jgi:hypothetical protein
MRKRLLIVPAAVALAALGLSLGIPAWLSSGDPVSAATPDFHSQAGWIYRPETEPPAVWDDGWGVDFILLPHTPESLDKHGVISTASQPLRDRMISDSANLITLLSRHGGVYMPALRVSSAASPEPDMSATRTDLIAALSAYFETDNRGRGVALVAQDNHGALIEDPASLLAAAELEEVSDRIVLVIAPEGQASGRSSELPNLQYATLPAETGGTHLASLMFLPNWPEFYDTIPDGEAASADLEIVVSAAVERLQENARKMVEPFGEMQAIEVPPIMRPDEPGEPGSTLSDATPG